jgi:hypothetical protein
VQKINLRKLYPDVYKTDVFADVAEIAWIEGADIRRVWKNIRRGLKKLVRLLVTS